MDRIASNDQKELKEHLAQIEDDHSMRMEQFKLETTQQFLPNFFMDRLGKVTKIKMWPLILLNLR